MKHLCFLLIFLCGLASAQEKLNNTITDQHQTIEGTKISFIVPPTFGQGAGFKGLQHRATNSSIMVMDVPGPYKVVEAGFTKENIRKQGVEVDSIQTLMINGVEGLMIDGKQMAFGTAFFKRILLFGTDTETILINGIAPEDNPEYKKYVIEALNTIVYEKDKKVDPYAALGYTIDPNGKDLRYATVASNSVVYTADGKVPTESLDKTSLVVSQSFQTVQVADKKEYGITRMKQLPMGITAVDRTEEIEIDGLQGVALYAFDKNITNESYTGACLVMLFDQDSYFIFLASTNNKDANRRLGDAMNIIESFRRKEP